MNPEGKVKSDRRRSLPSVDRLINEINGLRPDLPVWARTSGARQALSEARKRIVRDDEDGEAGRDAALVERGAALAAELARAHPGRVINATGIVLHTNLGRAPLAPGAARAVEAAARGYTDLELDLASGERGQRTSAVAEKLRLLSGAADALAVNNNAAAVWLVLSTFAAGREVVLTGWVHRRRDHGSRRHDAPALAAAEHPADEEDGARQTGRSEELADHGERTDLRGLELRPGRNARYLQERADCSGQEKAQAEQQLRKAPVSTREDQQPKRHHGAHEEIEAASQRQNRLEYSHRRSLPKRWVSYRTTVARDERKSYRCEMACRVMPFLQRHRWLKNRRIGATRAFPRHKYRGDAWCAPALVLIGVGTETRRSGLERFLLPLARGAEEPDPG